MWRMFCTILKICVNSYLLSDITCEWSNSGCLFIYLLEVLLLLLWPLWVLRNIVCFNKKITSVSVKVLAPLSFSRITNLNLCRWFQTNLLWLTVLRHRVPKGVYFLKQSCTKFQIQHVNLGCWSVAQLLWQCSPLKGRGFIVQKKEVKDISL